jgi:glucan 1,3-beta-glucosidase
MPVLKEYYWRSYQLVQAKAPHWVTLLPDSFRLSPENFGGFLQNCDNFAIDTHIYQAWAWENPARWFQEHACQDRERLILMESIGVPVIVGEWSLATDNCAMWLNGFNDNGRCDLMCHHLIYGTSDLPAFCAL